MNVTYTPKPCEGEDALFKGEVVLRAPFYEERMEMTSDPDLLEYLNQQAEDEKKKKGKRQLSSQEMRVLIAQAKWSYQFYVKVDVTRLKDKVHFKCLDDLRSDPTCTPILQDVAAKLASGFEMGNS